MDENIRLNGKPAEKRTLDDFTFLDEALRSGALEFYEKLFEPAMTLARFQQAREESLCASVKLYEAMKLSPGTVRRICGVPPKLVSEIYEAPRRFAEFLSEFPVSEPRGPFSPAQITRLCMFFSQHYLTLNAPGEELRADLVRNEAAGLISYEAISELTGVPAGTISAFAAEAAVLLSDADKLILIAHIVPPQTTRVSPDARLKASLDALMNTHGISAETLSLLRRVPPDLIEAFAAGKGRLSDLEKFNLAAVAFRLEAVITTVRAVPDEAAA
ncbi:MAG: hypothetical protein LBK23_09155 [Oscillospiraceae bacterium]|jgi:hypothetical protein|nr:hypothetical protein [Oscillospiraceae bacterium]